MSLEAERYRNEYIFVLYNNEFRKIALSDIMWIEASRSYCNILSRENPAELFYCQHLY